MVSWGPVATNGEKFYTGMKASPPWVRDLNWKHRCRLEGTRLDQKMKLTAGGKNRKKELQTRIGTHGAIVPSDPNQVETLLLEQREEIERLKADNHKRGKISGRSSGRATGRYSARSSRMSTGRSTGRSSMTMSSRLSTGRSSLGTLNTEIRDMIQSAAAEEIQELRKALSEEAKLRAAADAKIDKLVGTLEEMRQKMQKK